MKWAASLLLCVVVATSAHARGGGGGHVTTFDPNLYGGPANVSCIKAAAAGVCTTGYNAACDGVTSDTAAFVSFRTAAVAANPTRAVLYIPPGANCTISGGVNDNIVAGVKNPVIWGYGATVNTMTFGGTGFPSNISGNWALVQTFNPGDTTVTLVSSGDAAIFAGNPWIAATCVALQIGGTPPSFARFNYRKIVNITGSIITLSNPLDIQCKSTYPSIAVNGTPHPYDGGPAKLYLMDPQWDTNASFYGLTITGVGTTNAAGSYQNVVQGRTVALYDMVFQNLSNLSPTSSDSIWGFNVVSRSVEVDKDINSLNFIRGDFESFGVNFQSGSVNNALLELGTYGSCGGTGTNIIIRGGICKDVAVGPTSFGHGQSIFFDGGSVTAVGSGVSQIQIDASFLSFSSGTFSMAKSSVNIDSYYGTFVPGHKYKIAYANSFGNACSPLTVFTVTDMREDATNLYADTDMSTLPTLDCLGHAPFYVAYPAETITQRNSGPANLTQFAPP